MRDGYYIEEQGGMQMRSFYGVDETAAVANCKWYNQLTHGRRVFRVVLRVQDHVAVLHG
jgi:hypothetical protein